MQLPEDEHGLLAAAKVDMHAHRMLINSIFAEMAVS